MDKQIITIDGNSFSDRFGFFLEIKRKFTKGIDWVDFNPNKELKLPAVNDFLSGGFGTTGFSEPIILIWANSKKSSSDLGKSETLAFLNGLSERCHPTAKEEVLERIRLVEDDTGELLFDQIVKIISNHSHIELRLE